MRTSLDARKPGRVVRIAQAENSGVPDKHANVCMFGGQEFVPEPGVEASVSDKVRTLMDRSQGEESIVVILQVQEDMTLGDTVDLLEAGAKLYKHVGTRAIIVRLPVSSLLELGIQTLYSVDRRVQA